jgi:hypothetical protein
MHEIKNVVRTINDLACGNESILESVCGESRFRAKNYVVLIGAALFIQYLMPLIAATIIIAFIIGNVASFSVTMILALSNPLFLIALIPIIAVDAALVAAFVIGSIIIDILYWFFYFQKIGMLTLMPIGAWIVSFLASFIPYIGGFFSTMIMFMPWMAIASVMHWWTTKKA